ncbi:MAG: AraC family transcriptional regulator [Sphingomonadales bacterium]|nr:MAG: AraC family transcriptional regulator [Sphingomonadales bacterium]
MEEAVREAAPGSRLTVEAIAGLCGLSGRHLMRSFKAATGMTLHKYIERIRLERTKALLEAGDLPLKTIAGRMGFANASHLSAAFRKSTGLAPSAWRSRMNSGRIQ